MTVNGAVTAVQDGVKLMFEVLEDVPGLAVVRIDGRLSYQHVPEVMPHDVFARHMAALGVEP